MSTNVQTIKTLEKALKYNYLPAFENQITTKASPFLAKIQKVPLVSNTIVGSAPVGLSGGFGFGAEGEATPKAGAQAYEGFKLDSADMYVDVCISQKAVKLGTKSGSMVNALDAEIKGAYEAAKWNVARSVFGNGKGILTTIVMDGGNNTGSVADTRFLREGLIVDVHSPDGEVLDTLRIKSINRANKSVIFYDKFEGIHNVGNFLTVQNSYNREITGIGAIFDDSITSIYGVKKDESPFIKPIVKNAEGDISDGIIRSVIREAADDKNNEIDMLLCGYEAYDAYAEYLKVNNIHVVDKVIAGGFKALVFTMDNRDIELVTERFVPSTEMWGVNTDTFKLHCTEWEFAELNGGSIFNLMEKSSAYRALLTNYGNLMCSNPGGCVRLYNVGRVA